MITNHLNQVNNAVKSEKDRADKYRAEAEKALAADKYDIVITDLVMEKADSGFSLAFHIKKDAPETKVIIATDVNSRHGVKFSVDSEDERAWIKADAFLDKPYRYEQLRTVIERL